MSTENDPTDMPLTLLAGGKLVTGHDGSIATAPRPSPPPRPSKKLYKVVATTLRLPEPVMLLVKTEAYRDRRTLTATIEVLICEALHARGHTAVPLPKDTAGLASSKEAFKLVLAEQRARAAAEAAALAPPSPWKEGDPIPPNTRFKYKRPVCAECDAPHPQHAPGCRYHPEYRRRAPDCHLCGQSDGHTHDCPSYVAAAPANDRA